MIEGRVKIGKMVAKELGILAAKKGREKAGIGSGNAIMNE